MRCRLYPKQSLDKAGWQAGEVAQPEDRTLALSIPPFLQGVPAVWAPFAIL
jgi:hypothetical protein